MRAFRYGRETISLVVVAGLAFLVASQVELFEQVHEFTRVHEDWELDELFSFLMVFGLCLPVLLVIWNRRLRRSLGAQLEAEARAQHVSRHDPLTGLFNRRVMGEVLAERIARAEAGGPAPAVLLMDIDRFKPINDLRGHDVGDKILQEVARRLQEACSDAQLPIRLGGDEFAVIVDETSDLDVATKLARRILATMEPKFEVETGGVSVGMSIGVAVWNQGLDQSELLRHADQAMYRAKREGRGRIDFFDDALGERLREAAELEAELSLAIEAGDIVPHFQPILDISSRKVVSFEVLARWNHVRLGQVPPMRFITLAEDTGQINAISWLILRQACTAAREWPEDLSIAFNLSPRQFRDRDLAATIAHVLNETGFPPQRLEIEITETAVIEDLDHARETIEKLRWLGIRTALDDFGTGFSSLATLSKLPFDQLKIDRSFVTEVTRDRQKAKIVAGIISLADSLELVVTAEGIETEDTCALLADLNCSQGQGYLFDRPMPGDQVLSFLQSEWAEALAVDGEDTDEVLA